MNAAEAFEVCTREGRRLTVEEALEMGEEEFTTFFLMLLEDDPSGRDEWLREMARYYFGLYHLKAIPALTSERLPEMEECQ